MKKAKSWVKSEAKWAALILYVPPAAGLLAAPVWYLVRLLLTHR